MKSFFNKLGDSLGEAASATAGGIKSIANSVPAPSMPTIVAPRKCCSVNSCPNKVLVTCALCKRDYCAEHQLNSVTHSVGITRKRGGAYEIPLDLIPADERYVGFGSSVLNFSKGVKDSIGSTLSSPDDFACSWPRTPSDGLTCKDLCVSRYLADFRRERDADIRIEHLEAFLSSSSVEFPQIPKPKSVDTSGKRISIAAYKTLKAGLDYATPGLALAGKLVLYGMQAQLVIRVLQESFGVENNMIEFMFGLKRPLLASLRSMNDCMDAETQDALKTLSYSSVALDIVPSIFYLSRSHILREQRRVRGCSLADAVEKGKPCPQELLERLRPWYGPAAWLYVCHLPGVHDTLEWNRRYLQQVLAASGWTLVGAVTVTTTVPRFEHELEDDVERPGRKLYVDKLYILPSFCLALRKEERVAVLSIRGSQSALDWTINLHNLPEKVDYFTGPEGAGGGIEGGLVHGGIFRGAKAILEDCHMFEAIDKLVKSGYAVTIVGHSLGAGTAALIAVLLKTKYVKERLEGLREKVPFIPAICYACPPCMEQRLSTALLEDDLVVSVANQYDVVTRLSENNILPLAAEVFKFKATARALLKEDIEVYQKYATSLGAASRIDSSEVAAGSGSGTGDAVGAAVASAVAAAVSAGAAIGAATEVPEGSEKESAGSGSLADELQGQEETSGIIRTASVVASAESLGALASAEEKRLMFFVMPGTIVFFGKDTCGKYRAIVTDQYFDELRRIVLTDSCVSNHDMSAYAAAFRDVVGPTAPRRVVPVMQLPLTDGGDKFRPCGCCGEDPVWPHRAKHETQRASATRNCALCGKITCVVCAPAGEVIPGDGYGQEHRLSDKRQPLPSCGSYMLQRLCLPCYFEHHNF